MANISLEIPRAHGGPELMLTLDRYDLETDHQENGNTLATILRLALPCATYDAMLTRLIEIETKEGRIDHYSPTLPVDSGETEKE